MVSADCLTVIDHLNPGENKIFVTTDASDCRTGAVLSWGPTWETARPVAYDSMQLKGAQLHYPVHEKELLGIIRALKKWRADLLGNQFEVFTDHRTLENFQTQKALSRRQARWMEEMAQFDMSINYIRGEDNTVADALSRLPDNPTETIPDCNPSEVDSWKSWLEAATPMHSSVPVTAIQQKSALLIATDERVLKDIRNGYLSDEFC